jgi:tetratricopeptide (TPR) repeat protein
VDSGYTPSYQDASGGYSAAGASGNSDAARASQAGEGNRYSNTSASGKSAATDTTVTGLLDRGPDTLARMATQYLADGDQAFRERRYADAAHFYAKAIEFRPDEGVLYLVLADALFATGDYHYGAFALRRALELDPALASSDIDKHAFYGDAAEFDQQLQLLERFLSDRPTDNDARLLLAANYLFGKKPKLAIDLLEAGSSDAVRAEASGQLILNAAKKANSQGD